MSIRRVGIIAALACVAGAPWPRACAAINLELRPDAAGYAPGALVKVGVYAVSDDGSAQSFSALDLVLRWDPNVLELRGATNASGHSWSLYGFLSDTQLDGLNDSHLDGDALFQAASLQPATATAKGFLITELRFTAVGATPLTGIDIEPSLGSYSITRVYEYGQVNQNVTGTLSGTALRIATEARLYVESVSVPAGRTASLYVSGDIEDRETIGVTITLQLSPREGGIGSLSFTPAPPVDVDTVDDPWVGEGLPTFFDTSDTGSAMLNGAIIDNGTLGRPLQLTFSGAIARFPVIAGEDAHGEWDARLSLDDGFQSWWEGLLTLLDHGVVRVVDLGDGDGSESIDLRDFAEMSACYTGSDLPANPPNYPDAPRMRCNVYDFDNDGNVEDFDLGEFEAVMNGPGG